MEPYGKKEFIREEQKKIFLRGTLFFCTMKSARCVMKNKEETVLITAVDNGSTVELEINTTLPHEETKEMLAGAVCAVYGISDFHEGDVASFLEALADEYRKEERSPHSPLVN